MDSKKVGDCLGEKRKRRGDDDEQVVASAMFVEPSGPLQSGELTPSSTERFKATSEETVTEVRDGLEESRRDSPPILSSSISSTTPSGTSSSTAAQFETTAQRSYKRAHKRSTSDSFKDRSDGRSSLAPTATNAGGRQPPSTMGRVGNDNGGGGRHRESEPEVNEAMRASRPARTPTPSSPINPCSGSNNVKESPSTNSIPGRFVQTPNKSTSKKRGVVSTFTTSPKDNAYKRRRGPDAPGGSIGGLNLKPADPKRQT